MNVFNIRPTVFFTLVDKTFQMEFINFIKKAFLYVVKTEHLQGSWFHSNLSGHQKYFFE